MTTIRRMLFAIVVAAPVASCASGPKVVSIHEVVAMKNAGANDDELFMWVTDPSRTFDLRRDDVSTLVGAGVGQDVINEMLRKSDLYHKEHGHSERNKNGHKHDH